MADDADRAAKLQEEANKSAHRRTDFMPNALCKDCGLANDRPEYAICTDCLETRQAASGKT